MAKTKFIIIIVVVCMALITHRPLYAAGVVTTCDEASLVTALAGGGVVDFNIGTDCEIIFTSEKIISTDTTIQNTSNYAVTFSGDYYTPIDTRLFTVNSGISLTLDNLTLQNGKASQGGAIFNNGGNLIISDTLFNSNQATITTYLNPAGGAIYSVGGNVIVDKSYFIQNSAIDGAVGGGAIHATGGALTISDSFFFKNHAYYGVIDVIDSTTTITRTQFVENTSDFLAIIQQFSETTDSQITLLDNLFLNNTSNYSTVMRLVGRQNDLSTLADDYFVNFLIDGNSFVRNNALYECIVEISHSTIGQIINNTFYNNQAMGYRGGFCISNYNADDPFVPNTDAVLSHNTFFNNTALSGANIYLDNANLDMTANIMYNGDCSLANGATLTDGGNNIAYNATGCVGANVDPQLSPMFSYAFVPLATSPALNAYSAPCAVSDDQFGTTRPQNGSCDIGAIEGSASPNTTLTTCSESALNLALAGGGTVDFNIGADCTIPFTFEKIIGTNTTIQNTSAFDVIFDGGNNVGLFTVNNGATLTLDNLTLQNAYSLQGGAVFNDESTLHVIDSIFDNNHTYTQDLFGLGIGDGGAIFSLGDTVTTITGGTFSNNQATFGGAVAIAPIWDNDTQMYASGQLTVTDSTFSDNWAVNGGAIIATNIVTIMGSVFDNNVSDLVASVFYTGVEPTSEITVLDSAFINHTSEYYNGVLAIWANGGVPVDFSVQRNHFINNISTTSFDSCSAITLYDEPSGSQLIGDVTNNTFSGNSSTAGGGTVCIADDNGIIDIVHNTFADNNTPNGNNLRLINNGTYTATANIFQDGGCVFELGASLTDGGNNIAYNATGCVGANVDPQLGALIGGEYHIPANNAIEYAPACEVATDQLGVSRPFGALCTPGAVEIEGVAPVERDLILTENGLLKILSAQAISNTIFVVTDITPTNITIVMGYAGEYGQVVIHVNDADFTRFTIGSITAIGGGAVSSTYSDFVNQHLFDVMLSAIDEWIVAQVAPATAEIKQITISDVMTITVEVSN